MKKRLLLIIALGLWLVPAVWAQEEETVRPRTAAGAPAATPQDETPPSTRTRRTGAKTSRRPRSATDTDETPVAPATAADENSVRATFADLVKAIESVDVNGVTKFYWKSPQLLMFNRNGSITRGWEQMRQNRESNYTSVSDVKLTTRDVNVIMLGHDGAVLTFLWEQAQKTNGKLESTTGRTTLVFRRINNQWRIVHLHTSPVTDSK